jgi:hypothetical protein
MDCEFIPYKYELDPDWEHYLWNRYVFSVKYGYVWPLLEEQRFLLDHINIINRNLQKYNLYLHPSPNGINGGVYTSYSFVLRRIENVSTAD